MHSLRSLGPLLGLLTAMPSLAVAAPSSNLAEELVRLRGEVESLSAKLSLKEEDLRHRVRSLAQRRAELELELQRDGLELKQLQHSQKQQLEKIAKLSEGAQHLAPAVQHAIEEIRQYINSALPFRPEERLLDVKKLEDDLLAKRLTPESAVGRLWSVVEDEIRLLRESGLYRQVITIDNQRRLADVAKVGMVMLFFRTQEGEVGRAVKARDGRWFYAKYTKSTAQKQVSALFESFKKQIRSGFFTLPNALNRSAVRGNEVLR